MLNVNYNIKGRNRSILLIVSLFGTFFSVFYYTILYPDSPFNIPLINYSVTAYYGLFALVLYFTKDDDKIRFLENLYFILCVLIFFYNSLVIFSDPNPRAYIGVPFLLLISLVFSIDKYLFQRIFLYSSTISYLTCYIYFEHTDWRLIVFYFMVLGIVYFYLFFSKKAISRVATLSLNFERFINKELSGYVFIDRKKKKIIYTNNKAQQLWPELSIDFLLKIPNGESIEKNKLKFSFLLNKKNHSIYRIDDVSSEQNSIERYNHIFQRNLAGVYETDLDGRIIVANDSFAKIFGYENKEDIVNQNVKSFYKNPEDRVEFLDYIRKEKHLTNFETIQIDKNGKEFFVLNNIVFDERKNTLSGIIIDISAKKEHEKKLIEEKEKSQIDFDDKTLKLKGIFEGLKNVRVYTLDKEYQIISFNQTANDTYKNLLNKDLHIGENFIKNWKQSFNADYIIQLKNYIDLAFEGKGQYSLGKLIQGGKNYWIESYINPIYSSKGVIKEVSIINHDITEKQEYERKLKDSIEEKEVLLKEVHHRVKNNLQVISSILNLQSNYIDDEKVHEILSESQNRIKTMSFIHESLYQTKNFIEIRFSEHLEKLLSNLIYSYSIEKEKIEVESEIQDISLNLDLAIPCGLIVNEIISNSLKHAFTKEDNGKVTIKMYREKGKVCLEIGDNGKGMDENFDIYESNTLGLQLIITLVDQIDGSISIDNKEGTKFLIIFAA
jgi:PAS domain S-box-containing protein